MYQPLEGSLVYSRVAAVIGESLARKLCDHLGGTMLYVPAAPGPGHPLTALLGQETATLLARSFRGEQLQLPKAFHRRTRVIELKKSTRMTVSEIALATDYSERHVLFILAEERARESDGQLDLLDLL